MKLKEIDIRIWDNIVSPDFIQEYVHEINHPTRKWQFSGAGVPKDATIWFRELGDCERTSILYNEYIEPRLLADIEDYNIVTKSNMINELKDVLSFLMLGYVKVLLRSIFSIKKLKSVIVLIGEDAMV